MTTSTQSKKGVKPRIITFQPDNHCAMWRLKWMAAGFTPVVLPKDGGKDFAERMNAVHLLKRIQERPNAPTLEGYLRWIATTLYAPDDQYVFMTQPDIFPGDLTKGLLTEELCRHATAGKLCLLAGSDAVMGTKASFVRMCELLVADGGVTQENCTDGFIVRRVQQQMIDFIINLPCCKDEGEDDWQKSPLIRSGTGLVRQAIELGEFVKGATA